MIRFWIGTALLAGSWLLGLDYFYPANPCAWLAVVAAAVPAASPPRERRTPATQIPTDASLCRFARAATMRAWWR